MDINGGEYGGKNVVSSNDYHLLRRDIPSIDARSARLSSLRFSRLVRQEKATAGARAVPATCQLAPATSVVAYNRKVHSQHGAKCLECIRLIVERNHGLTGASI